jgi:hypothetical protein
LLQFYFAVPQKPTERLPVHPFPNDPDIGKLAICTEQLSQAQYVAMNQRFEATTGLRRSIELIDKMTALTWPDRPCRITVVTPRIVRLLHRALRSGKEHPVKISSFNYYPPSCGTDEFHARVAKFLQLNNLPSFLREVRDEVEHIEFEDPQKIGEKLFSAGLDDRYVLEFLDF